MPSPFRGERVLVEFDASLPFTHACHPRYMRRAALSAVYQRYSFTTDVCPLAASSGSASQRDLDLLVGLDFIGPYRAVIPTEFSAVVGADVSCRSELSDVDMAIDSETVTGVHLRAAFFGDHSHSIFLLPDFLLAQFAAGQLGFEHGWDGAHPHFSSNVFMCCRW